MVSPFARVIVSTVCDNGAAAKLFPVHGVRVLSGGVACQSARIREVRRRGCGMQIQEDRPQHYVDIPTATDNKMRPCAVASRPRPLLAPMGAQWPKAIAQRPVPLGLRPGRSAAALPSSTLST